MKVAITYDNGEIFQSFGHTEQFKIYEVNDGMITDMQIVNANGKENGALSGFLAQAKTDVLICGGIDNNAQTALANAGIQLYGGMSGPADEAIVAYVAGILNHSPNA